MVKKSKVRSHRVVEPPSREEFFDSCRLSNDMRILHFKTTNGGLVGGKIKKAGWLGENGRNYVFVAQDPYEDDRWFLITVNFKTEECWVEQHRTEPMI
ncbi:MAG: hypothetical protein WDZ64_00980 [Parcubacteria group bacterium]